MAVTQPARGSRSFAARVVGDADPRELALIELDRTGGRREWTFGELEQAAGALAGTLAAAGVGRGDIVLTLIGNRPEWVATMLAAFRLGAIVLPCTEQLRAKDLRLRLRTVPVAAVVADERNEAELRAAAPDCPLLWIGDERIWRTPAPPHAEVAWEEPVLMTFTSGTAGEPKCVVHAHRYLWGQSLQAVHWMGVQPGDVVWCTAASGWSKSARNAFVAPWLCGAAAVLHDRRFDPDERLAVAEQEGVRVLCMAPTEYRAIAKRSAPRPLPVLRSAVAAGEALDPEVLRAWREGTGLEIRDGYGQTETGQVTAMPAGEPVRPGSMGTPLPGVRAWIDDGELVLDPATLPTFFLGYWPLVPGASRERVWRTGDRVRCDDGYFYFEGRADDVIVSSGYRIGPFEVESALIEHDAVAEVAVVAHPDVERGSVVRAVVVLRDGHEPSDALARQLQDHVKAVTAPYKYPRVVEFVEALPKTSSGKVRRAALRAADVSDR
jgi:acyl-coenzyme A synthetase/AMP-(fatty) acid ligase